MMLVSEKALFPGPGKYNQVPEITPTGAYFLSKFKSMFAQRFGKSIRSSVEGRVGINIKKKRQGLGVIWLHLTLGLTT